MRFGVLPSTSSPPWEGNPEIHGIECIYHINVGQSVIPVNHSSLGQVLSWLSLFWRPSKCLQHKEHREKGKGDALSKFHFMGKGDALSKFHFIEVGVVPG
jgi:hypothetical protein